MIELGKFLPREVPLRTLHTGDVIVMPIPGAARADLSYHTCSRRAAVPSQTCFSSHILSLAFFSSEPFFLRRAVVACLMI